MTVPSRQASSMCPSLGGLGGLRLRLDRVEAKARRAVSDEVLELVRQRDAARAARDWKRSDEIRDLLKAQGFEVRDTPKGTELV